jgi:replicative DNA helicase
MPADSASPGAGPASDFLSRYEPKAYGRGRPGAGGGAGGPSVPPGRLFDRDAPYSLEAEQSLLGSMLLDPRVVTDVMAVVRGGGSVFYNAAHGLIYDTIVRLCDRQNAVDPVLLAQELADKGVLEQIGGVEFLVNLAAQVPTAANAPHFARIVLEKHRLRRLIDAAGQTLWEAYNAGQLDI